MRVIETERLFLRDFVESDWNSFDAILSDAEVTRYMHFATLTADEQYEWFQWCLTTGHFPTPDQYNWAIVLKATGQTIGWFGIGEADYPVVDGERRFGYLLAQAVWGQGYMTEALRAVLDYEFRLLGTSYISATCETANPASARVMEKAGMHRLKTVYDADFMGNWAERHHYGAYRPLDILAGIS